MQFEYRTKPIRVEAVQWSGEISYLEQPHWLWGAIDCTHNRTHGKIVRVGNRLQVTTASGTQMADDGDWIVFYTSTTSELRVFKPEEFRRVFEYDDRFERRPRLRSTSDDERQRERRLSRRTKNLRG